MKEQALVELIQYCRKMGRDNFVFYTFHDTFEEAQQELANETQNVKPIEICPLEDGIYMVLTRVVL